MKNTKDTRDQILREIDDLQQEITDLRNEYQSCKSREEALIKRQSNIMNIFNSIPNFIFIADVSGNVIECNQPVLNVFWDLPKEEVIGKSILDLFSEINRQKLIIDIQQVLKEDSAVNVEYAVFDKSGLEIPVEISISMVKDALSQPAYLIIVLKDIRSRKLIEATILNLNEELELKVESRTEELKRVIRQKQTLLDISYSLCLSKTFKDIGKSIFQNLHKYEPSEEIGEKLAVYDDKKDLYEIVYYRHHDNSPFRHDLKCKLKDVNLFSKIAIEQRRTVLIEDSHSEYALTIDPILKNEPGKVMVFIPLFHKDSLVGLMSFAHVSKDPMDKSFVDLLELIGRYASIALGELLFEKRKQDVDKILQAIVESFPDVYFRLNSEYIFLDYRTKQISNLFLPPDQFLGKKIREIFSLELSDQFEKAIDKVTDTKSLTSIEYSLLMDNKTRYFEARLLPLMDDEISVIVREITDRKNIETEMHRQDLTFENITDAVLISDMDSTIIDWNPAAEKLFGYTKEEVLGKKVSIIQKPFQIDFLWHEINKMISKEGRWSGEIEFIRKDGTEGICETVVIALLDRQGNPIAKIGVNHDITERKRSDILRLALYHISEQTNSTKNLQELYKAIHDIINELIFAQNFYIVLYDENTQTIEFPYFVDQFDPPPPPLKLGKGLTDYVIKTGEPLWYSKENSEEILKRGEIQIRGTLPFDWIGIPLKTEEKTFGAVVIQSYRDDERFGKKEHEILTYVSQHISTAIERKRTEEQIKQQAALLSISHDAIIVQDMNDKILFWNKGAERLYGWLAEEAVNRIGTEFLFKDRSTLLDEAKSEMLKRGFWSGELKQNTKQGKEVIVESHWTLMYDENKKPKSKLVVNNDITEKKLIETQFLRAQRMESIGTLASGIAHDLNNVLGPIFMAMELFKERFKDNQSQKLLETIETSIQRGSDLVKQVLSFARGHFGERVEVQMIHIISDMVKIAKETFPRSITISKKSIKNLWTVYGDPSQLHQVLLNLCVNARDAMPDGGTLIILAENIFIDENYTKLHIDAKVGKYILVEIQDTGFGIPQEIQDKIYEPFFTTKEIGKGTGLGLSTAFSIIKNHGGFINLYSELGKGTTFKIYLPAI